MSLPRSASTVSLSTMADVTATNAPCSSPPYAIIPSTNDKCVFRLIPKEILQHIVAFGDVASKVLLAATCTSFRSFVFNECPYAWQDICFASPQAAKLTDAELFALLTNVKAAQVTTSLSIMGCSSIQGRGLSALSYSRCLEMIELRKSEQDMLTLGPTGLDDTFVLGVLSSMAPINTKLPHSRNGGLKLVKIRKQFDRVNHYQCFKNQISNFLSDLNAAVQEVIRERRIVCHNCKEALVDIIKEEDFSWLASLSYCTHCKAYSCECISRCVTCLEQCCDNCLFCSHCIECEKCFCSECRDVRYCHSCEESYCEECRPTYYCNSNDEKCFRGYCENCVQFCSGCDDLLCGGCEQIVSCTDCHTKFCSDCIGLACDSCKKLFCEDCRPGRGCSACELFFCNVGKCKLNLVDCQKCSFSSCRECNLVTKSWRSCQGACVDCNIVCNCDTCKLKRSKQEQITKYFGPRSQEPASKRPRLS